MGPTTTYNFTKNVVSLSIFNDMLRIPNAPSEHSFLLNQNKIQLDMQGLSILKIQEHLLCPERAWMMT